MKASEVRERILRDHLALRGMVDHITSLAEEVLRDEPGPVGPLRVASETLLERLQEHMGWEDRYLRPALEAADAWGRERAEQLDRDHREQRDLLGHALAAIRDGSRPALLLARNLLDLMQLLREDIEYEERELVNDRVLRDDVVSIDANSG